MAHILTPAASQFIEQWNSPEPYIEAHTSGSTGMPKLIRLAKCDMRASAIATCRYFGIGASSLLYLPLSPDYIAGKMQIVRALVSGADLIVEEPSLNPMAEAPFGGKRVSLLPIVPAQAEQIINSPVLNRIDNIIVGGAPMPPSVEKDFALTHVSVYATYGMTETCSHVALRSVGSAVYEGLPGFDFSTDERGCLVISAKAMTFGNLVTNDMVRLISGRRFIWLGRYDNVINSGGVKIHPEEIEKILSPYIPDGYKAYVTSRQDERWGEEAVIVTDCPTLTKDVLGILKPLLAARHCPKDVIYLASIPLTSTGKIIRTRI